MIPAIEVAENTEAMKQKALGELKELLLKQEKLPADFRFRFVKAWDPVNERTVLRMDAIPLTQWRQWEYGRAEYA